MITAIKRIKIAILLALSTFFVVPASGLAQSKSDMTRLGDYQRTLTAAARPVATAIGEDGAIYIADAVKDCIKVVSTDGSVQTWGSSTLTASGKAVLAPQGIAIGPDGLIYISDAGNHRIVVIDKSGKVLRTFGQYGEGELIDPEALSVHEKKVYIADTGNSRVVVFSVEGKHHNTFGGYGFGDGEFVYPAGIAVDKKNKLYILAGERNKVLTFDSSGQFLSAWGESGTAPGMFTQPSGLDYHNGMLFVIDYYNNRITVFDTKGNYEYQWGLYEALPHNGQGRMHGPADVSVSSDGQFAVVCEPYEKRCQVFGIRGEHSDEDPTPWWLQDDTAAHYGQRLDAKGDLLVMTDPALHRIRIYNTSREKPILMTEIGSRGRGFAKFLQPSDVALDLNENVVYVTDPAQRRVQKIQLRIDDSTPLGFSARLAMFAESFALSIPTKHGKKKEIIPTAITIGPNGELIVLDGPHRRIATFNSDRTFLRSWGGVHDQDVDFHEPTDIALNQAGDTLFVVDALNRNIVAFDMQGNMQFIFGNIQNATNQPVSPYGIAAGNDDSLYVTDPPTERVLTFNSRGQFIREWGTKGLEDNQLWEPHGIDMDSQGRLILIDYGNHRGQIFTPRGNHVAAFGGWRMSQNARLRQAE